MGAVKTIPVVIDTNVLVSALLFGGTFGKLAPLWREGRIRPFLSREMIAEFIRVLAYPKFELTQNEIHYLLYVEVLPHFEVIRYADGPVIVQNDPQDDMFLRCAAAAGAVAVISGDRHLLSMQRYQDIPILSPAQFFSRFTNA